MRIALGVGLSLMVSLSRAIPAAAQTPDEIISGYGPPLVVSVRQDSLLEIAISSPDPITRAVAIRGIASPGRAWYIIHGSDVGSALVHYPGTVARLERIYRAMGSSEREIVVTSLAFQAERPEAVAFLVEVATRNTEMGEVAPLALVAVSALSRMGSEGAAALRQIHATGDHATWLTRHLEELARTGYRRPPGG